MKRLLKSLLQFTVLTALATTTAPAQSTISFDEHGTGTDTAGPPLAATVGPDPTGGIPAPFNVLSYTLPFAGTQGDLLIFNPLGPGDPLDDVVRFLGNGEVIFYADNLQGYTDLADTPGPPNPLSRNRASTQIPGNDIVSYTPTAGQPGFDPSDPTYNIYIDTAIAVPEPSPAFLVLIGLGAFALPQIWSRHRSKAFNGLCLATALLLTGLIARGEDATPQAHEICVGQRAPSFTLKDQNYNEVSLDGLLKKGPVAVVFIRSADWCLYCKLLTTQIQHNLKEIEASGGQVVVISYDSQPLLKRFADNQKITIPLLSDPGSKIIDAYDMRSGAGSGNQVGCSRHGMFILDQKGIVRAKPYPVSFEARPVVDTLVQALKEAQNATGGTKL